jgi:predicted ArsR family transcriptional regulator
MESKDLDIGLDRDVFLRSLIHSLSGVLEDVVGVKEAAGFLSVVGREIGAQLNRAYRKELKVSHLSREQVARVCVDLKRRIEGDFYIIEESEDRIVFGNRRCPFAEKVLGRPSLCMVTSNVFGHITAQNLGYAKVELNETIAEGHSGCRITVHLRRTETSIHGREYFQADLIGD